MSRGQQPHADYDVHITETDWWDDLLDGVFGPRQGGARIIVDAEGASTGVGKTGLAVYVALLLGRVFDYDLQPADLTLSGQHYLNRWREHPDKTQPSVLILDELGGAGAGHARRAMSQQNVDLGNAWQLMRKKRIVSLVTLPHWSKVDKDMRQQADFRLWCRKDPIGYFEPYQIGAGFDRGNVKTHGYDDVDRVRFPDLTAQDDPLYEYLASEKDDLLESGFFDADKLEDGDENDDGEDDDTYHRDDVICMLYESDEFTQRELAERFDLSRQRIGQIIRN